MKKLSIALIAMFASMSAFAAVSSTVPAAVASNQNGTQDLTLTAGAGLKFNTFTMTMSKGVSFVTTDDTAANAVGVNSKHYSSDKVYGGTTQGGSVAVCTATKTKSADLAAAVDDTGCNTSGS